MNAETRRRVMRSFLAALLQSDLSVSEMRAVADELIYGLFGRDLGEFVRDVASNIQNVESRPGIESGSALSAQELAYDLINGRRLSKKMVLQLMTLASPGFKSRLLPANASLRELIDKYFMLVGSSESAKFISILEGEPADAYMKGITRRDRAK